MKKIVSYEETKRLLSKGLKLYHHSATEKNHIWLRKSTLDEVVVRKDIFNRLIQEKFIRMEKNDFDTFNFIEMYGVK